MLDNAAPAQPESAALYSRAVRVMPSGITRDLVAAKPHPTYAVRGEGAWIIDADGNRRIDWVNNFSSMIHGHAHPAIVEVIATQAGQLMSAILPTEWEVKLAELLCERIPSIERVRFMNSGTEANQIAIKAARCYTGKPKIAKMEGGYHGQFDLLEASFQPMPPAWGDAARPVPVAHNRGTPQSLLDELVLLPLNDIPNARDILRANADSLAAVIIDPMRLQLGMVAPEPDFIAMLREETARLGIVLIFDEVWSLRAGYGGMQGELGITPDLTTMGKIIGGGLPVGGVGGRAEFMSVFDMDKGERKLKHSGTFTGNPMTMAAGYTGMSLLTRAAFDDLAAKGERLREGLARAKHDLGMEATLVGIGSLSALLPTTKPLRNYRELLAAMMDGLYARMEVLQRHLLDEGLLTMRGGYVGSTPMTDDDIDFTIRGAGAALSRFVNG